jgi:single-strand DNA-binding protein
MHHFFATGTRRNFLARDLTGYSLVVAPPTGYISATIKTFEGTTTMANKFSGRGNLGADPELRYTAGEDSEPVCSLRVFFDRPKPDGNGGFDDKGGFWLDVSLWGTRGEAAAQLLKKGARVSVSGELYEDAWQDNESGEERRKLRLRATHVDLDLVRLEGVNWHVDADVKSSLPPTTGA